MHCMFFKCCDSLGQMNPISLKPMHLHNKSLHKTLFSCGNGPWEIIR